MPNLTIPGVRVVSDGTAKNTRLFNPDGSPMCMDAVRSVTWHCDREGPTLTVEYLAWKQPVDLLVPEQEQNADALASR